MSSDSSSSSPWCVDTLWWPVEVIPLRVMIVEPRRLTALEWAILRVMEAFGDEPPPLAEVARQLGLEDPVFLEETLDEVVELNALAPTEGAEWADLSDLAFTEVGLRLFRKGQIEAAPATHGVTIYIDPTTDEVLAEPLKLSLHAERGLLADQYFDARETLGLDRVREVLKKQRPDLMKGEAEVREVLSAAETRGLEYSSIQWRPLRVEYRLTALGELECTPQGLSSRAAEFLASQDLAELDLLPDDPISAEWPPTTTEVAVTGASYPEWLKGVVALVAADDVAAKVTAAVRAARSEVVLHAFWLGLPGLDKELRQAVARGVRALAVGDESGMLAWQSMGAFLLGATPDECLPCGLIVDGERGFVLDEVVATCGDGEIGAEVVGALAASKAGPLRDEMVFAGLGALPTPVGAVAPLKVGLTPPHQADAKARSLLDDGDLRLALARVLFQPDETEVFRLYTVACGLCPGLERLALLQILGQALRAATSVALLAELDAPWNREWQGVVYLVMRGQAPTAALIERLGAWAPPSVELTDYVDFAIRYWVNTTTVVSQRALRLAGVAAAAETRWPKDAVKAVTRHWAEGLLPSLSIPEYADDLFPWLEDLRTIRSFAPEAVAADVDEVVGWQLEKSPDLAERILSAAEGLLAPDRLATLRRTHLKVRQPEVAVKQKGQKSK